MDGLPLNISEMQTPERPSGFAAGRDWIGPADFHQCPTLAQAWRYSAETFARVDEALAGFDPAGTKVVTLAAAGSLGRMEALPHSDCDLIVIVPDEIAADSEQARAIMQEVWERLQPLELRLPKSWGIFVEPASIASLTRPGALGDLNDSRTVFGKRLQCLLDSQPLFRAEGFRQVQKAILDWYATAFATQAASKQWTYLLNDLIRYYRSYAAWQQFELKIEWDDSWYIRNAKLRGSRLIMYAGMLLLLGESSRRQPPDKVNWLLEQLTMTTLERVVWCMQQYGEDDVTTLLQCYETFLAAMADDDIRNALIDQAPRTLDELPPAMIPAYAPIQEGTARLMSILTRFVLNRADDWHPRFLQYLLF